MAHSSGGRLAGRPVGGWTSHRKNAPFLYFHTTRDTTPPSPYPPDHPKSLPGAGLIPPSQFAHASLERHLFTPPTRSERRTNDRGGHFYLTVRRTFSLNSDSGFRPAA